LPLIDLSFQNLFFAYSWLSFFLATNASNGHEFYHLTLRISDQSGSREIDVGRRSVVCGHPKAVAEHVEAWLLSLVGEPG
jgi:hypothetical protein